MQKHISFRVKEGVFQTNALQGKCTLFLRMPTLIPLLFTRKTNSTVIPRLHIHYVRPHPEDPLTHVGGILVISCSWRRGVVIMVGINRRAIDNLEKYQNRK